MVAAGPSAGFQPKEVFSTDDGGQTWVHLSGSLDADENGLFGYVGTMVFSSDTDGWMASPRAGLLHSPDGGKSWLPTVVKDDNLSDLQFIDAEHGWTLSLVAFWSTDDGGATWKSLRLPDTNNP